MKKYILILFISLSVFSSCSDPVAVSPVIQTVIDDDFLTTLGNYFPDTLISCGEDSNFSYISLKTSRGDSLLIELTGWGIDEMGIILPHSIKDSVLNFSMMGYCGTVSSRTEKKVTMPFYLDRETEKSINKIIYINYFVKPPARDSIILEKRDLLNPVVFPNGG